jgi:predicted transcriptional regulator
MTYEELIEKAMKGRSVNRAAKELGLNQRSLDRYVKGERTPDYRTGLILAKEAGIGAGQAMLILADEEERQKGAKEIISRGFRLLTNAANRLLMGVSIA